MLIAITSDTHSPRYWRGVPAVMASYLFDVDLILHAGDVCTTSVLNELATYAPVKVVMGNNDGFEIAQQGAQAQSEFALEGINFAMIHNSGLATGRAQRMRSMFPTARVVVFGHSHAPFCNDADGLLLFNPGSPTNKRTQAHHTFGLLNVENGTIQDAAIIAID